MILYKEIRNDIVKALEKCENTSDVFDKYDNRFLKNLCGSHENLKELPKRQVLSLFSDSGEGEEEGVY